MNATHRKLEWLIWSGLIVTMLVILAAVIVAPSHRNALPVYGSLPAFTLKDQNGAAVSLDSLRGQAWIADVIFTRCPGQCLLMTSHMKQMQDALPAGSAIKLVSFTTDPAYDTPPILKKYADRFGADDSRWLFLTGDKAELHRATVDGMKLAVLAKPAADQTSANDLFIHSEKFVLIDKEGQLRGYFDGEQPESVSQAVAAARQLARQ